MDSRSTERNQWRVNEWGLKVSRTEVFVLQPYVLRRGELTPGEQVRSADEDAIFRRARAMQSRVAGAVFYRIDTSSDGDVWTEVEVLTTMGDVPDEGAA